MFTADFFIDTVQTSKKQFVNTFVQHEGVKKALNEFVDSQTAYTKSAVKSATEFGNQMTKEGKDLFAQMGKLDMTKFDMSQFDVTKYFKTK